MISVSTIVKQPFRAAAVSPGLIGAFTGGGVAGSTEIAYSTLCIREEDEDSTLTVVDAHSFDR